MINFKAFIGFAISIVILLLLAVQVEWGRTLEEVKTLRLWLCIPVLLCFILHFYLRTKRWRVLLDSNENIPQKKMFDSIMVGSFATFILPLRAGEFVRPFMLSQLSKTSFASSFISVVLERFFDLSAVLLCFLPIYFSNSLVNSEYSGLINKGALGLSFVACAILALIVISSKAPKVIYLLRDVFNATTRSIFKKKLNVLIDDFISGTKVLKGDYRFQKIILYTFLIWSTAILRFYLLLLAFPTIDTSLLLSAVITVTISLAVAAPSAPGFIGVYELGCIIGFYIMGLDKNLAVAFALVSHVLEYILVCSFGLFGLLRNGLNLSFLKSHSRGVSANIS
jgi:glycosyltransferase 2 family protein